MFHGLSGEHKTTTSLTDLVLQGEKPAQSFMEQSFTDLQTFHHHKFLRTDVRRLLPPSQTVAG